MAMRPLSYQDVVMVSGDTVSGANVVTQGKEQFFNTSLTFSKGLLLDPHTIEPDFTLALTTAGGSLLNGVLTACKLRLRTMIAPSLAAAQAGTGTVVGDTGSFGLVGSLLNVTNAQIYLTQKIMLKAVGPPGTSLVRGGGRGWIYPVSGQSAVGITMPFGNDLDTLDCNQTQYIFLGVTFDAVVGANSLTFLDATMPVTG